MDDSIWDGREGGCVGMVLRWVGVCWHGARMGGGCVGMVLS